MLFRIYFIFTFLFLYAVGEENDDSLERFIKLTVGVSKATYLSFKNNKYLQNGRIMEKSPSNAVSSDIPEEEKAACNIGGWTAKSYESNETEVLMFKNANQRLVVFGFRGTDNEQDWGETLDMMIVKETIGADSFTIHKGFLQRYHFISAWFENEYRQISKDYTILLTGHSLGGTEATIAAVYAAGKLNRKPDGVITYGSPKVGAYQFKWYYQRKVSCDNTIRMKVSLDQATRFPPFFPYTHVCPDLNLEVAANNPLDLYYHELYGGYEDGIADKYQDGTKEINIGCDKEFVA